MGKKANITVIGFPIIPPFSFDSWFAHDKIIISICATGYGVICRLKKDDEKRHFALRRNSKLVGNYSANTC